MTADGLGIGVMSEREAANALLCYQLAEQNRRKWLGFKVDTDGRTVVGYCRASGGGYFARKFEGKTVSESFELAIHAVTNP